MDFDEVTKAAERRGKLAVLPSYGCRLAHVLPVPVAMCPRSHNPIGGTIEIRYDGDQALEVVTLLRFLKWAGQPGEGKPRSTEAWVKFVGDHCAKALGCVVWVMADVECNPGPQTLRIRYSAIPSR